MGDTVLDTMDMVLDTDMDTTESVMLSQRLMLIPTFCMVDTTDTVLDTMDMVLDIDMGTMESVRLNQRLMLMLTCTVDIMVLEDTVDMVDIMDIDIMESALLMLSPRLTPIFCMEDMDTLDMPDTMDTPMLLTVITDKLFPLVLWTANHPCFLYQ